jgi:putative peptidoglycan lipid II flippase
MSNAATPELIPTALGEVDPQLPSPPPRRSLGSAAMLVATLTIVGSVLGLGRDLVIAQYFGTTGATDAFLVAWTLPDTAQPLLMDAMSLLLVPLFARQLALRGDLREMVAQTLFPVALVGAVLSGVLLVGAPVVVDVLAPGLAEPEIAAQCVRAASATILLIAVTGYVMAALRAHNTFGWPASVSVAYNVGILSTVVLLHDRWGVLSAALGLSVGTALMLLVQTPPFLRQVGLPRLTWRPSPELIPLLAVFIPLACFTLGRQSQVFVERFFGSMLDPGAITQLNYATKVAQLPMILSLAVALVSLPTMTRQATLGLMNELRGTIEGNLRIAGALIVPAIVVLLAFAPEITRLLFQRGELRADDAAAIATLLRIYSFGLVAQVIVGVTVQAFVCVPDRTWYPAWAALACLVVTAASAALLHIPFGARGLAAANAIGISVMASALLVGVRRRVAPIDVRRYVTFLLRCGVAGVAAGIIALAAASVTGTMLGEGDVGDAATIAMGGAGVLVMYAIVSDALGVEEISVMRRRIFSRWGKA